MNMLRDFIKSKTFLIFLFFVIVHLIILNINYAEWGDSYRILRASEFLRNFSYPDDEKRQPLYSIILALRPGSVDQIFWGRLVMFFVSIFSFVIFTNLLKLFKLDDKTKYIALTLFILNPVLLYWSIRIYADMFFALIVLAAFYIYLKNINNLNFKKLILLGALLAFGILTRFEGYILAFSIGLGLIYELIKQKTIISKTVIKFFLLTAVVILILLPWFIFRNPLDSKYFEEPSGRAYDLKMLAIYFSSLICIFGFTPAGFFILKNIKNAKSIILNYFPIFIFVTLEMILALIWPAAIPRLFVPAIPFMIILLSKSISDYFNNDKKNSFINIVILLSFLSVYIISQYFLKLQFLVLIKNWFIVIVFIQVFMIFFIFKKKINLFYISLVLSTLIWSISTIVLHKDIYKAVVEANIFITKNIKGVVAYNDVSSVSDWYLNQKSQSDGVSGFYLNMDSRKNRTHDKLLEKNVDYVMITNEHNTDMEYDPKESKYLEQIKEFSYTINGKKFFTKIIKVNR